MPRARPGYLVAGVLVDNIGLRAAFAVFVGAVVLAARSVLVVRPLRELDHLPDGDDDAAVPAAAAEPVLPGSRSSAAR